MTIFSPLPGPHCWQPSPLAAGPFAGLQGGAAASLLTAEVEAMAAERFMILSHPQVHEYLQRKASNAERWLTGMRRLRDKIYGAARAG